MGRLLGSELESSLGTPLGRAARKTVALQLLSAVAEIATVVLKILLALGDLLGVVVAGVGHDAGGSHGTCEKGGEVHIGNAKTEEDSERKRLLEDQEWAVNEQGRKRAKEWKRREAGRCRC